MHDERAALPADDPCLRKVFGVGLNKTGTTTFATCMQSLGYRHMGYRLDLLRHFRAGNYEEIFAVTDRYQSFDDWPYPLMYKLLADRYPDARFVLTVRADPEAWFESLCRHSRRSHPLSNARRFVYGYRYPDNAKAHHIDFYLRHNAAVQAHLGSRVKVLCWENGDGWNELTSFLGISPPDLPFPHVNAGQMPSRRKQLLNSVMRSAEAAGILLADRMLPLLGRKIGSQ